MTPPPQQVCQLRRAIYGLKQAPRAWFERFRDAVIALGFIESSSDMLSLLAGRLVASLCSCFMWMTW